MKKNVYYHNNRCGKSREALRILQERGVEVEVIKYLETPPSKQALRYICKKLNVKPIQIIRTKEKVFKELGLSKNDDRSDDEWFSIMIENPILIERPILVYNNKVALGRPPENVLDII